MFGAQEKFIRGGDTGVEAWRPIAGAKWRGGKGHFCDLGEQVLGQIYVAGQEWWEMKSQMQAEPGPEGMVLAVTQTLDRFDSVGQCFSTFRMSEKGHLLNMQISGPHPSDYNPE